MNLQSTLMLFCLVVVTALCIALFYKTRKVHLMQFQLLEQLRALQHNIDGTYQQVQAFIGLHQRLHLDFALPPLRGWAASPDFLLLLAEHADMRQPQVIVECSSGASTIVLAHRAKHHGRGHVYSLEHDPVYAHKTREELLKHQLQDWATVVNAPLRDYDFDGKTYRWYQLDEAMQQRQIDMLVIDGPPGTLNKWARYPAGPLLFKSLTADAMVFLDDANRPEEKEIVKKWTSEFPELTAHTQACEKGAVILRKDRTV